MDYNQENLYEIFELLLKYCPNKLYFKSIDSDTILIRSDIKDASEAAAFVQAYEVVTHSRYVVYNSCKSAVRLVYSKMWACHRRTLCKRIQEDSGNCQAKISIKIKINTKDTRKRDSFLKMNPPLPAVIRIHYQHNHSTTDQQALKVLKVAREVKECFFEYFRRGIYGMRAKRVHENNLRKANFHSLDDASINPRLSAIYNLYKVWQKSNKGAKLDKNEASVSKESNLEGGLNSDIEEDSSLDSEDNSCFINVKEIVSKFNKNPDVGNPVIDKNTGEILGDLEECDEESDKKSISDSSQSFTEPEVNNSPDIVIQSCRSLAVQNSSMNKTAEQGNKVNSSREIPIKLQPTRIPVMSGHITANTQVIVYNAFSNVSQTFNVLPVSFNSNK